MLALYCRILHQPLWNPPFHANTNPFILVGRDFILLTTNPMREITLAMPSPMQAIKFGFVFVGFAGVMCTIGQVAQVQQTRSSALRQGPGRLGCGMSGSLDLVWYSQVVSDLTCVVGITVCTRTVFDVDMFLRFSSVGPLARLLRGWVVGSGFECMLM